VLEADASYETGEPLTPPSAANARSAAIPQGAVCAH
jgi:hypothetical protein